MIYFDIDDTLTDSDFAHKQAIIKLFKYAGGTIENINEAQKIWLKINAHYFTEYDQKKLTLQEQRTQRLIRFWNVHQMSLDFNEASELYAVYLEYFLKNCVLFEDVQESLRSVAHLPLGIISNGVYTDQLFKLENNRIKDFFSEIIISEEIGVSKPDSAIFHQALSINNRKAYDCYYIGNSYTIDYEGARNVGLNAIWINRLQENKPTNKDESFPNLKSAIDMVLTKF